MRANICAFIETSKTPQPSLLEVDAHFYANGRGFVVHITIKIMETLMMVVVCKKKHLRCQFFSFTRAAFDIETIYRTLHHRYFYTIVVQMQSR